MIKMLKEKHNKGNDYFSTLKIRSNMLISPVSFVHKDVTHLCNYSHR